MIASMRVNRIDFKGMTMADGWDVMKALEKHPTHVGYNEFMGIKGKN